MRRIYGERPGKRLKARVLARKYRRRCDKRHSKTRLAHISGASAYLKTTDKPYKFFRRTDAKKRLLPSNRSNDAKETAAVFQETKEFQTKKIRQNGGKIGEVKGRETVFTRPGDDRLSRVLRQSTIGVTGFHFRVRDGIECYRCAIITGSCKYSFLERRYKACKVIIPTQQ